MLDSKNLKVFTQPLGTVALVTAVSIGFPSASQAQRQPTPQNLGNSASQVQRQRVEPNTGNSTSQAQRQPTFQNIGTNQVSTTYTLGGGDVIRVNVFEVPEYTGEYQIPPGGGINLPLIGSVNVRGLTTEQAADLIASRYSRYLKRPLISVNLLSPRPINILVSGEVTRPGAYTVSLQGGAGDTPGVQYPTLLSALTVAAGTTQSADLTRVELRRSLGGNRPEEVLTVNLKDVIRTGRFPQDLTLRDGDSIYVPTANNVDLEDVRNTSAATFASDPSAPRTVAVIGEVIRPGTYLIAPGAAEGGGTASIAGTGAPSITNVPTVTRALQSAGGITAQADVRNVVIRRRPRTGGEQLIKVDLWKLIANGDLSQDTIVQDGDTIVFPTATETNRAEATQIASTTLSPATIQVGVVGEVRNPGRIAVQPNSSLNQVLLAAGGFAGARADNDAVDLVRLNPDGSVTKRKVRVDLKAGINEQTNPIIRNNDVIVVYRSGAAKFGETVGTVFSPFFGVFGFLRSIFGF
jgi:polysaccharide export outer membrane protein